ncbi:hypothetical protein ACNI65_21840 [Roseateles sp. So40a]|uniref:hypothetical protein n=1 Tax=Roseateles sp. So40a TaxID=3400226 RepID=UPI003A8B68DF
MFSRTTLGAWALALATPAFAQHPGHGTALNTVPARSTPKSQAAVSAFALGQGAGTGEAAPGTAANDLRHLPTFESYRRFADEPIQSWKAANDRVGQIGGWRAYAKEASGVSEQQSPDRQGHAGHEAKPEQPSANSPRPNTATATNASQQTEMAIPPANAAGRAPAKAAQPAAAPASQAGGSHPQYH